MKSIKPKADFLIEVSYEIVAKLGGIHTVIKTKAPFMNRYYKDNYLVIGLYDEKAARKLFKSEKPTKEITKLFQQLKKEKIFCHYGTWLVKSSPKAILIDIKKLIRDKKTKDIIRRDYWINFLKDNSIYNESILFSYAAGRVISELQGLDFFKKKKIVVNLHEYMMGVTLFYLRKHKCDIPIVFTTHATVLGRAIAFSGRKLYQDIIGTENKIKTTKYYLALFGHGIYNKHLHERACIKKADVFTAVSEITSNEAEFLHGNRADIITPNGLEIIKYPSIEKQLAINYKAKQRIYNFLKAYFSPYYPTKVSDSLLLYTAGRNEIFTKGYDIFFEALRTLNKKLKKERFDKNIFVFLFIMTSNKKVSQNVIKSIHNFKKNRKISNLTKTPPNCAFKTKKDQIVMMFLRKNKLFNKETDKVKVIFYPAPVEEDDGLLSMTYDEIISGMDMGIFPSLYEPWGYTPLETAAMSTISLTTDVAGFGRFIKAKTDQRKMPGIIVLKTKGKNRKEIVSRLSETIYDLVHLPKEKRIEKRIEANKLASLATWNEFSKLYIKAHNLAIKRHKS